jgi:hypothetical protein
MEGAASNRLLGPFFSAPGVPKDSNLTHMISHSRRAKSHITAAKKCVSASFVRWKMYKMAQNGQLERGKAPYTLAYGVN